VQVLGGVLDARELGVTGDVAGDTDVKEITEPLVEDDFRRHARVGAAQHRRLRVLSAGQFALPRRGLMRMLVVLGDVTVVAGPQLSQHGIGGGRFLLYGERHCAHGGDGDSGRSRRCH
jgi:hypothetical protein